MRHHFLGSICLFLGLSLAACGGKPDSGGSTSSSTSSTQATIATNVVKGIIQNGVIVASRWENGAYVQVGTANTDSSGNFSLTLSDNSPGVLKIDLQLSTDSSHPTTMVCDAATCGVSPNTVTFGQPFTLTSDPGLSTWATIDSSGNVTVMPMSPISTFVVDYANAVGGNLNANSLQLAENRVAIVLGLELTDLLTQPGDLTSSLYTAAASATSLKLSLLAAAFAQLANAQNVDVATVISSYVNAFISNNGRLLQSDSSLPSVAGLLQGAVNVANTAGIGSGTSVTQTFQTMIASQVSGQLSTVPSATFDSTAFLNDLGPLGGLITTEMTAEGATSLQQLVLGQLSQFGWLRSSDTTALMGAAVQVVAYSMLSAGALSYSALGTAYPNGYYLIGSASSTPGTLVAVLNFQNKTLTFNGTTASGVTANNLVINLTPITAGSHANPFVFSASGSLTSGSETASINGTLTIDPQTTDLTALDSFFSSPTNLQNLISSPSGTQSLLNIVATLLQSGNATFTASGSASLAQGTSTLGVSGSGSLSVDMAGGGNGTITASGSADGTLTLPNGMSFSSDPGTASGNNLTFSLTQDGAFSTQFTASNFLKLPATQVTASGSLTALGTLLSSVRDSVVTGLNAGTINLSSIINTVLGFDYSTMHLTLNGSAAIPAPISQTYSLNIASGVLTVTQPGGVDTITLSGNSTGGFLFQVGSNAWEINFDFSNEADPVFVFTDPATGGSSSIDLNSVL